jgi:MFS transporter, SP family, sugar:H+ symporter
MWMQPSRVLHLLWDTTMATTASDTDFRKTSVWENRKSILICALIGTASFQYGFDQGMIGGFQAMVGFLEVFGYKDPSSPAGFNLTVTVQQLISSLMTLGAFIGALSVGPMGGYINRRWSIFVGSVTCVASLLIMIFTTNLGALYFGRLLLGVAK